MTNKQPTSYQQQYIFKRSPQKHNTEYQQIYENKQAYYNEPYSTKNGRYPICSYHFNDSLYKGQMKAFQRKGKGILLHDNGLCGIVQSGTNRLKGHNIFIGNNIIISIIYHQHNLDIVYKQGKNIFITMISKIDGNYTLNSLGYLIEFDIKKVSKLKFKNNLLVEKITFGVQQTKQIVQKLDLNKLMKQQHVDALKLNVYDKYFPQIDIVRKKQYQFHIGYMQRSQNQSNPYTSSYQFTLPFFNSSSNQTNKQLQTLGFILQAIQINPINSFEMQFKLSQRGFYSNGQLQYFGQQFYNNQNSYFGYIKDGKMHGKGLMTYKKQKMFTEGIFQQGVPKKLNEDYGFNLNTEEGLRKYQLLKRSLHKQDTEIWIDSWFYDVPDPEYFNLLIKKCKYSQGEDQEIINMEKTYTNYLMAQKVQSFITGDNVKNDFTIPIPTPISTPMLDNSIYKKERPINNENSLIDILGKNEQNDSLTFSKNSKIIYQNYFKKSENQSNNPFKRQTNLNQLVAKQASLSNRSSRKSYHANNNIDQQLFLKTPLKSFHQEIFDYPFTKSTIKQPSNHSHSRQRSSSLHKQQLQSPIIKIKISTPKSTNNKDQDKDSIIRLNSQEKKKIQQIQKNLLKQYEDLENRKFDRSSYENNKRMFKSPVKQSVFNKKSGLIGKIAHKNSPLAIDSILTVTQKYHHNSYADHLKQLNRLCLIAGNQAIKLAHLNKAKQQRINQYEHYTYRKRFDYTSQIDNFNDNYYLNNRQPNKFINSKTPQKVSKYYKNQQINNRTMKKDQVDKMINRLYPQHGQRVNQTNTYTNNKTYDSRYYQDRPLGKTYYNNTYGNQMGKTNNYDQNINKSSYYYGKNYESNVLRDNIMLSKY